MQTSRKIQPKIGGGMEINQSKELKNYRMLELVDKNIERVITVFHMLRKLRHGRYIFLKRPKTSFKRETTMSEVKLHWIGLIVD